NEHFLDGVLVDVAINTRFGTGRSTEQFKNGYTQGLAFDVPQSHINRGNRGIFREPLKIAEAMHHIPMVLYGKRILALQVLCKTGDAGACGLDMPPGSCLAIAGETCIGNDAHKHELADVQRLYFLYFHTAEFHVVDAACVDCQWL